MAVLLVEEFVDDRTPTKNINSARERRALLTFMVKGLITKDKGRAQVL